MTLKEKQKRMPAEKRRIQIMEESLKLIAKNGFEGTKTLDIAKACGVSEAALYKLFKSKEELFFSSIEYKFGGASRQLLKTLKFDPKKPKQAMRITAEHIFDLITKDPDLTRVIILTLIKYPECIKGYIKKGMFEEKKFVMKALKQGERSGKYKKLDMEIAAPLFAVSVVGMIFSRTLFQDKKISAKERDRILDQVIEIYLHGVMK